MLGTIFCAPQKRESTLKKQIFTQKIDVADEGRNEAYIMYLPFDAFLIK